MRKKRRGKYLLCLLIILIGLGAAGAFCIKTNTYQAETAAVTAALSAQEEHGVLFFEGDEENPVLLFYQGAFVENESYAIWAKEVAAAGYSVYLLKQPLNIAVFGRNDAERLIKKKKIGGYVIGGHSLGGVIGSRFAHKHMADNNLKGVLFLGSYPDEKGSLSQFSRPVLSITATNDGVLNRKNFQEAKVYLPKDTQFEEIQGGNHAGFGSYGQQKGDHQPEITNDEQQKAISNLLIHWLSQL